MGNRFKDRELGAIETDERVGTEAGAAGGVGCFDVGDFCEGVGCRSAGRNNILSSKATSGGEASTSLRVFSCGTFSMCLLSIVLLTTKFESPVCEGWLMGNRFTHRGRNRSKRKRGAEGGAAGGVCCFDVGNFCDGVECRSADSNGGISSEATIRGEASACLRSIYSTIRVLEGLNDVQKRHPRSCSSTAANVKRVPPHP